MSSLQVPSLQNWLESVILLPQYVDILVENGYDTLHKCVVLTSADLDRIGITLPGHKKRILSQLAKLNLSGECYLFESGEIPVANGAAQVDAQSDKSGDISPEFSPVDVGINDATSTDNL